MQCITLARMLNDARAMERLEVRSRKSQNSAISAKSISGLTGLFGCLSGERGVVCVGQRFALESCSICSVEKFLVSFEFIVM